MAADAAIPLCLSRTHRPRRGVAPHRGGDVNADVSVPPRVTVPPSYRWAWCAHPQYILPRAPSGWKRRKTARLKSRRPLAEAARRPQIEPRPAPSGLPRPASDTTKPIAAPASATCAYLNTETPPKRDTEFPLYLLGYSVQEKNCLCPAQRRVPLFRLSVIDRYRR